MGIDKKYALLDTDFLYKSHLARNEKNQAVYASIRSRSGWNNSPVSQRYSCVSCKDLCPI